MVKYIFLVNFAKLRILKEIDFENGHFQRSEKIRIQLISEAFE